jgi:hypothetical protein
VECKKGASWVQKEILEEHPDTDLRVYVVWFNMLSGDSRSRWDDYLLYGPEATWGDAVPRPMSSGYTVYGAREELKNNILPLLE